MRGDVPAIDSWCTYTEQHVVMCMCMCTCMYVCVSGGRADDTLIFGVII